MSFRTAAFDLNPQPMFVYDIETLKFVSVNRAALRLWGYTESEFLSLSPLDLRPPAEYDTFFGRLTIPEFSFSDKTIFRYVRKDGTAFQAEAAARVFKDGGRLLKLAILNDVTARIEAQRKFADEQSRRQNLFDLSPDMLFEFEENGLIVAANMSAERITGFTKDELSRKSIWDLVAPSSRSRVKRQWILSPEREIAVEILTSNGSSTSLELRCSVMLR